MNTYRVKLNVELEIQAFDKNDIADYVSDILSVDDEIVGVHITSIKEK